MKYLKHHVHIGDRVVGKSSSTMSSREEHEGVITKIEQDNYNSWFVVIIDDHEEEHYYALEDVRKV